MKGNSEDELFLPILYIAVPILYTKGLSGSDRNLGHVHTENCACSPQSVGMSLSQLLTLHKKEGGKCYPDRTVTLWVDRGSLPS